MPEPMVQSSRGSYAGVMALGAALACLAGWALGAGLGADATSQALAVASLVVIGIIAILPGLVLAWPCPASRFGSVILIATMLQTLGAVALGALWTMTRTLDRVPFWSALVVGAVVLLTVEVGYAIVLLSRAQGRISQGVSDSEAG